MSELGEALKNAREEKGLTLDNIQEMTKIQKRYLQAIEKGDFDSLPGHFYSRAFIKRYAEAVGLDPDELFDQYKASVPSPPTLEPVRSRTARRRRMNGGKVVSGKWLSTLLLVLFIGLIAYVLYTAFSYMDFNAKDPANDQQQSPPITSEENMGEDTNEGDAPEDVEEQDPADEPQEPANTGPEVTMVGQNGTVITYEVKNADRLALTLKAARGRSWVGTNDVQAKTGWLDTWDMNQGDERQVSLTERNEIWVRIGNYPVMDVMVNGISIQIPEAPNVAIWLHIRSAQTDQS